MTTFHCSVCVCLLGHKAGACFEVTLWDLGQKDKRG